MRSAFPVALRGRDPGAACGGAQRRPRPCDAGRRPPPKPRAAGPWHEPMQGPPAPMRLPPGVCLSPAGPPTLAGARPLSEPALPQRTPPPSARLWGASGRSDRTRSPRCESQARPGAASNGTGTARCLLWARGLPQWRNRLESQRARERPAHGDASGPRGPCVGSAAASIKKI